MQERRVALASGMGVSVLEAGSPAARPLFLLHGFAGAKEDWGDHLDDLAALGWRCVAPDLRGHGGSDGAEEATGYGLRIFAGDLLDLARVLGWRRFTLLGHSMGGMVAQHVALTEPGRLEGLVLMSTSPGPPEGIDPALVDLAKILVSQGGMSMLVEAARHREGALETPAHARLLRTRPGYREFGEAKMLACAAEMWVSVVDEILAQPDRLEELAAVRVPTLVVVGEQDKAFLSPSRRLARAIPGARLAVIPDAGHSPQFENPQPWFDAVSAFLASLPQPARR